MKITITLLRVYFHKSGLSRGMFHIAVLFLIILLLLSSCTTNPIVVSTMQPTYKAVLPNDSKIIILRPLLRFERLRDEVILNASEFGGTAIEDSLYAAARAAAAKSKIEVIDYDSINTPEFFNLCSKLRSLSSQLAAGHINDEVKEILQRLSVLNPNLLVLSHFLYVKVGPRGYWNPCTGAIGSSMSTSFFQASLIHCNTGKILWKNKVFLRQLPRVNSPNFKESIQLLYANFPKTKK